MAMFTNGTPIVNINTILVSGTSIAQGLFIEMFLTAELVFVILMLAAEKSKDTFMAPIGIGLALFVAELSGKWYRGKTCGSWAVQANLYGAFCADHGFNSRCLLYRRVS